MPYPNQFSQPYQYQYQPQVPAPMDRLAQLQSSYQQYQTTNPPQTNQGLLWVQGEAAARSYLVAPNTTVLLMDSESQSFYLKSTDNSGMPLPLRIFDYTERTVNAAQNAPQAQQSEQIDLDSKYVTRGEYDALQGKYMEILERLNNFPTTDNAGRQAAATNKSKGKGGDSNE